MQPLVTDDNGVLRFKKNKIVRDLLDFASSRGFDLNAIAMGGYSKADQEQFAQLIGYSLSGFSELSYVRDKTWARAVRTKAARASGWEK